MIIFYDAPCPLCNRSIRFIIAADKKKKFYYAPLEGETARLKLKNPPHNTLILYESPDKVFYEGKAVLRIAWHLGGKYALIGWMSFLPSIVFDACYKLVAKYRYKLFSQKVSIVKTDRFLP